MQSSCVFGPFTGQVACLLCESACRASTGGSRRPPGVNAENAQLYCMKVTFMETNRIVLVWLRFPRLMFESGGGALRGGWGA